jgi:hypothetical protein
LSIQVTPSPTSANRLAPVVVSRLDALGERSPESKRWVRELLAVSVRGLPQMHTGNGRFVHTVRAVREGGKTRVIPQGDSLRYAAIVALGLAWVEEEVQRQILNASTAAELAVNAMHRAAKSDDPGAIALAAWAAAEAGGSYAGELLDRLAALLASGSSLDVVDCAWTLTAALAARHLGSTQELSHLAARRLLSAQGRAGLFPHVLSAEAVGRLRAHVGCFADQVYPIQALARFSVAMDDPAALEAADACAARICDLQGPAGQWWWHYDVRNGSVIEGYPVYSVHQHAMAPMALFDLWEAGGRDLRQAIVSGLDWLDRHPETSADLVSAEKGVIWRKIARLEPRKAVRSISAFTTALRPGLHLPGLDTAFRANQIDYECRPYELGWMLYAWLSGGADKELAGRKGNDRQ